MSSFTDLMDSMEAEERPKPQKTPKPAPKPVEKPLDRAEVAFDEVINSVESPDDTPRPTRRPTRVEEPVTEEETAPANSAVDVEEEEPLPKADKFITALYVLLCIISLIELYSASSRELNPDSVNVFGPLLRHALMMCGGIILFVLASRIRLKYYIKFTVPFVVISIVLMIYTLLFGHNINGATRSVSLLGIPIQPAELIKISAVLIIAYIMSRNQEPNGVKTKGVIWSAGVVLFMSALLFSQGLTNTLLLMGISLSMMLIGGVQWKKFLVVILIYGLFGGCGMAYKLLTDDGRGATWRARLERHSDSKDNKWEEPITQDNAQEMYSYLAQGHGGLIGVGPGHSRENMRLPLAFSDYIYSIVVEEIGFAGGIFLLFIYLSLLGRAGMIASRCDRAFPAMLVMGMAVMIVMQALFHMAINTGVFPVSGQPLPMISQGGMSMWVTSLGFGIMLSISRYATMAGRRKAKKVAAETGAADVTGDVDALNPSQLRN